MKNFITISIGISAYNEGNNIQNILNDLKKQELKKIILEKIIVISDGSTDDTYLNAKKTFHKKLYLINGKRNLGKAERINQLMKIVSSEILIILDADVRIYDKYFINKMSKPLIRGDADLVSPQIDADYPKNFFEKSLWLSMLLKQKLFSSYKNGNNVYSCHGPARAIKKSLYKNIRLPRSEGEDMYSYLICLFNKNKFSFIDKTRVFYKLPDNWLDHFKQSVRFRWSKDFYKQIFGEEFVNNEFKIPFPVYIRGAIKGLPLIIRNPVHFIYYLIIVGKCSIKPFVNFDIGRTWQIGSTKEGY